MVGVLGVCLGSSLGMGDWAPSAVALVRTGPFSGQHGLAEEIDFFPATPDNLPGPLDQDWVMILTMGVHRTPWGAM